MFETKRPVFYKYLSYLTLLLCIGSCAFFLIRQRLHQEQLECFIYAGEIYEGVSKIKPGMTIEEVVKILKHPPDSISRSENGTLLDWSPFYHTGTLTDTFYEKNAVGIYWVFIKFDSNDKVVSISAKAD